MAPKGGRGGGGHISFGGGDGSNVDPTELANIFNYVMLGLFGLYYIYTIRATIQQKQQFPYVYLYHIVGITTLAYLLAVLGQVLSNPVCFIPFGVFIRLSTVLTWLFAFEPSRHIMNLKSSNPAFERTSLFNIKQYLHSGAGYAILFGYIYGLIYMVITIAYYAATATVAYNPTFQALGLYLSVGAWPFFLIWIYLAIIHQKLIPHIKSFYSYGFFLLLAVVGRTVLVAGSGAMGEMAVTVVGFVLVDLSLFLGVYIGLRYGANWVGITKFDLVSKH
ncbi:hypothetical protein BJ944DRAFT_247546 [Cunninghamella echinulata]|nr:hypothetical protein BJ944DRAFT_247546 [Cunninghamella echinulata]